MLIGDIIPKVTAPYSSVDCIVVVYIFFIILALTSDSEFSTLSKFIFPLFFLSYVVDLFPEVLSMMTTRYSTDARHGISSPAILKFQSGSLLLYHMALHLSGENLRPSSTALVPIFFSVSSFVGIMCHLRCFPRGLPDHQRRRSFVLC